MTEQPWEFSYGIFWENGERATLPTPDGPVHPNNFIHDKNDPWMLKLFEWYPKLTWDDLNHPLGEDWGDFFIIVNDPEANRLIAELQNDDNLSS